MQKSKEIKQDGFLFLSLKFYISYMKYLDQFTPFIPSSMDEVQWRAIFSV